MQTSFRETIEKKSLREREKSRGESDSIVNQQWAKRLGETRETFRVFGGGANTLGTVLLPTRSTSGLNERSR